MSNVLDGFTVLVSSLVVICIVSPLYAVNMIDVLDGFTVFNGFTVLASGLLVVGVVGIVEQTWEAWSDREIAKLLYPEVVRDDTWRALEKEAKIVIRKKIKSLLKRGY